MKAADIAASPRWPTGTTPGLARLRANKHAERIRQEVLADQDRASANAAAAIVANSGEELAAILAANRHAADIAEVESANRADIARIKAENAETIRRMRAPAGPTAPTAAQDALSTEARALLAAVAYSPALRDLEPEEKVGKWVAYKTIHESDRPHGLNRRRVPGFMTTLSRRGFVECRAEKKAGQYSACVTAAGVALLAVQP